MTKNFNEVKDITKSVIFTRLARNNSVLSQHTDLSRFPFTIHATMVKSDKCRSSAKSLIDWLHNKNRKLRINDKYQERDDSSNEGAWEYFQASHIQETLAQEALEKARENCQKKQRMKNDQQLLVAVEKKRKAMEQSLTSHVNNLKEKKKIREDLKQKKINEVNSLTREIFLDEQSTSIDTLTRQWQCDRDYGKETDPNNTLDFGEDPHFVNL